MFAESLAPFFDLNGFAVQAVRTPPGGTPDPAAAVIFDHGGLVDGEFGVATRAPELRVPSSVWPDVAERDEVQITGAPKGDGHYVVRSVAAEDDGAITLCVLAWA